MLYSSIIATLAILLKTSIKMWSQVGHMQGVSNRAKSPPGFQGVLVRFRDFVEILSTCMMARLAKHVMVISVNLRK